MLRHGNLQGIIEPSRVLFVNEMRDECLAQYLCSGKQCGRVRHDLGSSDELLQPAMVIVHCLFRPGKGRSML